MKKIVLLHTVKSVYLSFESQLREAFEGMPIQWINFVDEYLAIEPNTMGSFSETNQKRLESDLYSCALTGADLIVVTCSTLSPRLDKSRQECGCPIIAIDERMVEKAVSMGNKITLLATQHSPVEPVCQSMQRIANGLGKKLEITTIVRTDAMDALKAGNSKRHDEILMEMSRQAPSSDVVVLAQASMAHMEEKLQEACNMPVLSSPKLCIEQIAEYLV